MINYYRALILLSALLSMAMTTSPAQGKVTIFSSKFLPESVTYNGSPNPNECWESVAWGVRIISGRASSFFTMDYKDVEKTKEKAGDSEVLIEVAFYDEPLDGSGAEGRVIKIVLKGEVIYESK